MTCVKKVVAIFVGLPATLLVVALFNMQMNSFLTSMDRRLEQLEQQVEGSAKQLRGKPTDLAKNVVKEELISDKLNNKEVKQEEAAAPSGEAKKVAPNVAAGSDPWGGGGYSGSSDPMEIYMAQMQQHMSSIIVNSIIGLIFAFMYKQKVVDQIQPLPPQQPPQPGAIAQTDFKYGVFSCFDDTNICLHATCCGLCRNAHTLQVVGAMDYWMAILVGYLAQACSCWCCFSTYTRMETKKRLGIPADAIMDCLCSTFCACCAVAQAAREVDERTGVVVKCCCDLSQQARQPVVMGVASAPPATEMAYPR